MKDLLCKSLIAALAEWKSLDAAHAGKDIQKSIDRLSCWLDKLNAEDKNM